MPEAEQSFREALRLDPESTRAEFDLGMASGRTGVRKRPWNTSAGGVDWEPEMPPGMPLWALIGEARKRGGRHQGMPGGYQLNADDVQVRIRQLAKIYFAQGDMAAASNHWQESSTAPRHAGPSKG